MSKKQSNKKLIIIISSVIILLIVAGVGGYIFISKQSSTSSNPVVRAVKNQTAPLTVDEAFTRLKDKGFTVANQEKQVYQIIGAYNGYRADVNDTEIEIYEYTKEQQQAKENATGTLANADNTIFTTDSLLVLIHSTDKTFTQSIKEVIK